VFESSVREMAPSIVPVILCGGLGSRLWPSSNDSRPKPFLPLIEGKSTFAATLERIQHPSLFGAPVVVVNRKHRHLVSSEIRSGGVPPTILLEPEARDTALAVAVAAAWVARSDPGAILLILAADHLIRDVAGFHRTVTAAAAAAERGHIVVFGVAPTFASTSFGYIRRGAADHGVGDIWSVAEFVEKPGPEAAADYVAAGFLWNSGNFMLTASTALAELTAHVPDIQACAVEAVAGGTLRDNTVELLEAAFRQATPISFDRAVMERTRQAVVIEAGFDWSDLGTWATVYDSLDKDQDRNVILGNAALIEAAGNLVASDGPLVGLVGVDDLVVVANEGAVLVGSRGKPDLVRALARRSAEQSTNRPHAGFLGSTVGVEVLEVGSEHSVRRLLIRPGQRSRLGSGELRDWHLTVVDGSLAVSAGGDPTVIHGGATVSFPGQAELALTNVGGEDVIAIVVDAAPRREERKATKAL